MEANGGEPAGNLIMIR